MTKQEQTLRDLEAVDESMKSNIQRAQRRVALNALSEEDYHEKVISMYDTVPNEPLGRLKSSLGVDAQSALNWKEVKKSTPTLEELRVSALYSMNKNMEAQPQRALEAMTLYKMLSEEIRSDEMMVMQKEESGFRTGK